jgi:glycosyltransferase involved in cell wall biosynthesis
MTKISVIVCTYNAPELVRNCLNSILEQDYDDFEVICVDGMSSDSTQDVIRQYKDKRIRLVVNKKGLPEGKGYGKWLGCRMARGNIIGIIDQDNVLQKKNLFSLVVKTLKEDMVGVLGAIQHDLNDEKVVRYTALVGTDSFFAYRSVDFLRNFQSVSTLSTDNMSLTGGNCFFYSRKALEEVGGYDQDVLVIKRLIKSSRNKLGIIPDATKHYAEKDFASLIKKKFFWGSKYYQKDTEKFDYFPKTKKEKISFVKNLTFNMLVLPNFIYSFKIYSKSKDPVIFLFPLIAFLNTVGYGLNHFINR